LGCCARRRCELERHLGALKGVLAAERGRSAPAEVRETWKSDEAATKPEGGLKLGELLTSIAREAGGFGQKDVEYFRPEARPEAGPIGSEGKGRADAAD
jgi:hypothetical protein